MFKPIGYREDEYEDGYSSYTWEIWCRSPFHGKAASRQYEEVPERGIQTSLSTAPKGNGV